MSKCEIGMLGEVKGYGGQELHYYSLIKEREREKYTMATSNGSIITEWSKC
jgi:hypothetical protein